MKKKYMKKMVVGILLSVVVALGGTMTTFAEDSTVSGSLGGQTVRGSITKNATSATATTTCTRSASVTATAKVYYTSGGNQYYSTDSQSVSGGTAIVTVSRRISGATVKGGRGIHSVYFDGYSWNKTTSIGTIYAYALEI